MGYLVDFEGQGLQNELEDVGRRINGCEKLLNGHPGTGKGAEFLKTTVRRLQARKLELEKLIRLEAGFDYPQECYPQEVYDFLYYRHQELYGEMIRAENALFINIASGGDMAGFEDLLREYNGCYERGLDVWQQNRFPEVPPEVRADRIEEREDFN